MTALFVGGPWDGLIWEVRDGTDRVYAPVPREVSPFYYDTAKDGIPLFTEQVIYERRLIYMTGRIISRVFAPTDLTDSQIMTLLLSNYRPKEKP
jgi:hypothetical protein